MAQLPPLSPAHPCYSSRRPGWAAVLTIVLVSSTLWSCTPTAIQVELPTRAGEKRQATTLLGPTNGGHNEHLELTPAEPEQFMDEEIARFQALGEWNPQTEAGREPPGTTYDFPVEINKHVQFYLDYFQNDLRTTFSRWLALSGRYVPMIQEELRAAGLPQDLAWLPMIESGYNLTAYSRARAVGPWQFMAPTARQYGLAINDYVDERRDPVKSTQAAITFLRDLHTEFGCWQLAVAAYNAGGGRIRGAIRRFESENFWEISRNNHLSRETRHYVPKLIAAIIIAKNPEQYGFANIAYDEPLRYETIEVPRWTSLEAVALAGGVELEELHDLNRQLRRLVTPPDQAAYSLRVPAGSKQLVAQNLGRVQMVAQIDYRSHVVQRGDTLTRICNTYNINKTTLLKANSLKSEQLVIGQRLRIPVQRTAYQLLPEGAERQKTARLGHSADGMVLHTIQPGESLWIISRRYGVGPETIAAWNDIEDPRRIRAGQQLALYLAPPAPAANPATATAPAPAARQITARAPAQKASPLRATAGSTPQNRPIAATQAKRPPTPETTKPQVTYYQVRGGDTLWSIARKFQVTTEMIREWNQLTNDLIHPGHQLMIRLAQIL